MKGRALILIFLFLILIFPAAAFDNGDGTGQFTVSGTVVDGYDALQTGSYDVRTLPVDRLRFNDVGATAHVSNVICTIPIGVWAGGSANSDWGAVSFQIGGVEVATGTFGYMKGTSYVYAGAFFDEGTDITNGGTFSGQQTITITGDVPAVRVRGDASYTTANRAYSGVDQATDTLAYMGMDTSMVVATYNAGDVNHETKSIYSFENSYTYSQTYNSLDFTLDKSSLNQSQVIITNNGGKSILNETSTNAIDIDIHESDLTNTTWTVDLTNVFGDQFSDTIYFKGQASTGNIVFNQTFYTDPEDLEVEWNIDNYDGNSYLYELQVITTVSGDPSQDLRVADGNWNTSPIISSASGAAVFDFYSDGYDLPIWIQAELWAQDKNTGTWTRLDCTPVERYHKSVGDASISLNATYDVGDIALITWQPADEDANLIIQFTNLNTSYSHAIEPYIWIPGTQQFEVYFTSDYIGEIKVELIENGVVTAAAYTTVSSPTTPYIEWYNSKIPLGTDAYYRYYTDNSSDTITIYGPEDQLYNQFSAESGFHQLYTTTAGKDAGIWTISLLHDGTTYYNDSMSVTTAEAFVRFDGDEFEVGDTINITYQLSSYTDEIWIFDSNNKIVVQFTCQWGVLTPGVIRTVDYPLVDNNKYGHDIETLISAGHYKTGVWNIYIVRNGIPSSESDEWDTAMIKGSFDDPADTSNEMISIFFSPEGVFMLFTVCLTMMGLVLSGHPAGGGAGAVVGVGFGVYFKVLPPWMLILTVITLVVLAGVSIAVHFNGK